MSLNSFFITTVATTMVVLTDPLVWLLAVPVGIIIKHWPTALIGGALAGFAVRIIVWFQLPPFLQMDFWGGVPGAAIAGTIIAGFGVSLRLMWTEKQKEIRARKSQSD